MYDIVKFRYFGDNRFNFSKFQRYSEIFCYTAYFDRVNPPLRSLTLHYIRLHITYNISTFIDPHLSIWILLNFTSLFNLPLTTYVYQTLVFILFITFNQFSFYSSSNYNLKSSSTTAFSDADNLDTVKWFKLI